MKRLLTLLGLACMVTCLAPAAHAQKLTGASYNDSCFNWPGGNNTTRLNIYANTTAVSNGCLVETNYGDGSKKDTASFFSGGYTFLNHNYGAVGTYTVKHVLLCGGNRVDSIINSYTIACTYIGGNLYNDANTNCIFNTGEAQIQAVASIEVDSAGVIIDTINAVGQWGYGMRAITTTVYKFKMLSIPGYTTSCPSTGVITYTYNPSVTVIPVQNFGFNCTSTPVYHYRLSWVRSFRAPASGGSSYIYLYATNTTCHTGTGTVTLKVSPKYNITTASINPTPASISGNTITWTINNMGYGVYTNLYVPLTPKSTTALGDTACNYAAITPAADAIPANNIINLCDSVSNSWDPNEKSVTPNGAVSAGTMLTYTIDFENLGNDTAFNIHVQDTLSPHLNANTFALIGSSHRVIPTIYEISGGTRILKFDFPGIKLESKTVPSRNKGQVRFTMKLKAGLPVGTVIPNRAGIYFDGNPVVLTDYAYSRIPVPAGLPSAPTLDAVKIFPNPTSDAVSIRVNAEGWNAAILTNALGQVIVQQSLSFGDNKMQVEKLPAGIYYLQTKGSAGTLSQKIEKQ